MPSRAQDWMDQARRDLDAAGRNLECGIFEWACFISQQAGEKAVKAVFQHLNAEAWGHSVSELLQVLPEAHLPPPDVLASARELDTYYIPTRYPNGFPAGAPKDYFTAQKAREAITHAEAVVRFCEGLLH